jgi:SNF2 family DNA or RNA helicase
MDNFENVSCKIDSGMDIFNKYIEKSGMEKKSYQYDGVKWLLENELRGSDVGSGGMRGGFVADEMGLGKTIMMIGLCLANFVDNRTLIVLPPVLIQQWFTQIYKTTGHKCAIYHGKNKKNFDKLASHILEVECIADVFANAAIVLCSYNAISIFREKKGGNGNGGNGNGGKSIKSIESSLLHRIKWGRVIFDEAHHLRNKNTSRYFGAKMLNAGAKWLVSGTPIQNKKQDFYALCSLINLPASYYTIPDNYNEIANLFILKRTKKQVGIDLEDATYSKKIVPWKSEAERKFSQEIHSLIAFTNIKQREDNQFGNIVNKDFGLLPLLLKARQSCIYPKMVKMDRQSDIGECGLYKEAIKCSSKLDCVVDAILERKDNGNGKLVFCHFKEEMNEIAERLRSGLDSGLDSGLNIGILDGKTSKVAKEKLLTERKDVLIMQIQTGCEGLNLQDNYSEIYFVSPHWNPYVEDQAIARCHRIGQKKPVFVWRFEMNNFDLTECGYSGDGGPGNASKLATKNLEEYVVDVQNSKRNIVSQLIHFTF